MPSSGLGSSPSCPTWPKAAAGASAGIAVATVTRDVEHCRTVDAGRDVLEGYDVTYRYQGRDLTTRMQYDPGTQVQVRVEVVPALR